MTTLQEMHDRTSSNKEFDRMIRSVAPMCDYFNVNQFYYIRIQANGNQGSFTALATHLKWQEFLFENTNMFTAWPVLRHPELLSTQITLLKKTGSPRFNHLLDVAWSKFNINLTIHIQKKIPRGIEAYGFGVNFNQDRAEEHLLNELPLINKFITYFHNENEKLIHLAHDHQVEISSLFGPSFYETPNKHTTHHKRELLLKQLGLGAMSSLTPREIEILKFMVNGFPANYIAKKIHLSRRTVENYIVTIKSKLDCNSKVDLINKAKDVILILNYY